MQNTGKLSKGWLDTVNKGLTDPAWDKYDTTIRTVVSEYNNRLGKKSRNVEVPMPLLDWKWVKAIIWVESGGPTNVSWNTRPMQIGNPGDPALSVLQNGDEYSSIIMNKDLQLSLDQINTPQVNIKAGVAYLINRLAKGDIKSLRDGSDNSIKPHEYPVVKGDSFSKISTKVGTTVPELKIRNPGVSTLKIGQKIKYFKASNVRVIQEWRTVSSITIAKKYNVGDPNYSAKLNYVLELFIKKRKTPPVDSSLKGY